MRYALNHRLHEKPSNGFKLLSLKQNLVMTSYTQDISSATVSKLHCQRALLFHQLQAMPPTKEICSMNIINKTKGTLLQERG